MEERKKNRIGRKEGRIRIRREESKQKEDTRKGEEEKKEDKVTCSFPRRRSEVHQPCAISFPAYSVGVFM